MLDCILDIAVKNFVPTDGIMLTGNSDNYGSRAVVFIYCYINVTINTAR
jgi:hypothetical protein